MRGGGVGQGGAADEGCGEAPGEADEEEAEGVADEGGGVGGGGGHCWGRWGGGLREG